MFCKRIKIIRLSVAAALLLTVILVQSVPGWGDFYSSDIYPTIAGPLSSLSGMIPFAVGDLFIFLSIIGIIIYPLHAHFRQKKKWRHALGSVVEYLLWVYIWFYMAWGLNYSQSDFYQRTGIPYAAYTSDGFRNFIHNYVSLLNDSFRHAGSVNRDVLVQEVMEGYRMIGDNLGIHTPFNNTPQVKTMLFGPLASMAGVKGSMGPFFCEFTINSDVMPTEYPSTYAHELAHLLGISNEAEANFYAYRVCTRSSISGIRFSGYLSALPHVLNNARQLLDADEYEALCQEIRPEILDIALDNQRHWKEKYSPAIGRIQDFVYDLYLKGNHVKGGRKSYSQMVGILISYEEYLHKEEKAGL